MIRSRFVVLCCFLLLAVPAALANNGSRPQDVAVTHVSNGGQTAATILTTSLGSTSLTQSNYLELFNPPLWVNGNVSVGAPSWGIAFPDPDKAIVTHPFDDFLSVVERTSPTSGSFSKTDEIAVPLYCTAVIADPNDANTVYVANRGDSPGGSAAAWQHSVLKINLSAEKVSKTIPVEHEPRCLALSPDSERLYVGHVGGALGGAGIATDFDFANSPDEVFDGGSIVVVDVGGSYPAVARIAVGSPVRDVLVLQPTEDETPTDHYVLFFTHVGDGAAGEDPDHGGRSIPNVVSSVRIDADTHAIQDSRRDVVLAHDPDMEFTYDPDDHVDQPAVLHEKLQVRWDDDAGEGELWITNSASGTVSRVRLDGNGEIAADSCVDVTDGEDVLPVVAERDGTGLLEPFSLVGGDGSTTCGSFPSDPEATWKYFVADDPVHVVVDAAGASAAETFASSPRGIVLDEVFDQLYVATFFDNELIRISPESTAVVQQEAVCTSGCTAVDDAERNFFTFGRGFDFRESGVSGEAKVNTISCSTCHVTAHLDGKVRVTNANGQTGKAVAVPSIFDVGATEWIFFGGGFTVADRDPSATCGYCAATDFFLDTIDFTDAALSPVSPTAPGGSLSGDQQAGRSLFQTMNCVRCHAGEVPPLGGSQTFKRTNSALPGSLSAIGPIASTETASIAKNLLHDPTQVFITDVGSVDGLSRRNKTNVGTGLPDDDLAVNTPALAGAWDNAPYFHDGRYRTLEAILEHTWLDPDDGYRAAPIWGDPGAPDNAFDTLAAVGSGTVPTVALGASHHEFWTHAHSAPSPNSTTWVSVSSHLNSGDRADLVAFLRALSSQTNVPTFFPGAQPALRQEVAETSPRRSRLLAPAGPRTANDTVIRFELAQAADPELRIYDVSGRLVRSHQVGSVGPGAGRWQWDGADQTGNAVASGVYFVRFVAGADRDTEKLVLVR
ncbi:MAG TPA: FlgD immunoglobulin-like domain containing protein [bacterium]|nr:FlgD immunoglobulin-like domain containing protein [bacterium]